MLRFWAKKGANINIRVENGITPLIYAVLFATEKEKIVEVLLELGALADIPDRSRCTALIHAKQRGDTVIVEMLKNAKQYREKYLLEMDKRKGKQTKKTKK